jgi:Ca-activated chloride channel homolog
MKNDLNVRCIMSKDALPVAGSEQAIYTLVDIKAGSGTASGIMPLNFAAVLDRSGSMDGEKMKHMKEAVGYVVDNMNDRDSISVIIFDDQVQTLVSNQPVKNRNEIKTIIDQVIARGGTQISDGLKTGIEEVKKGFSQDRVNRILLLTDGQTWDDEDACIRLADEAGRQGIAITTVGLGEEWNEKLLLQIAERSHGDSYWIQNPLAILDTFRKEMTSMLSVAATNLKLTARMSPGVRPSKVYTALPMITDVSEKGIKDNEIVMDLGSLDGTKGQMVLIKVLVPPHKEGAYRLGQVEVSRDIPSQNVKNRISRYDLSVTFTANVALASKVNAEVMHIVEKVSAFKLQTRALTEAEAGNIASATQKLQAAATVLLNLGEDDLAETAKTELLELQKTGTMSAVGTKKLEYGTRKLTQTMMKS